MDMEKTATQVTARVNRCQRARTANPLNSLRNASTFFFPISELVSACLHCDPINREFVTSGPLNGQAFPIEFF